MDETKAIFQSYLRNCVYSYRITYALSQEKMAEYLHVSTRSYVDQEHSKYGFSAMSFVHYILLLPDNTIIEFFKELRILLEEDENSAA